MLTPGTQLGHYRILEKIGAGGMGEIYRAQDLHLARDVALKVLPAGVLADEAARKRFRKEALALSKLNHPYIETVYDFDTQASPGAGQAGTDFLVLEYIAGESLVEKLAPGPLPEKEVLRLGQQLAEGLAAAHAQGVIHRDLKPANLRVTPDGRLKILDFGLAKLLRPAVGPGFSQGAATTESLTETQTVSGTLPYMAPEQLRGEPVDARTDLWAAGAVLYELATGQRPFETKLATALITDIQMKSVTPPSQLNPRISPRLEELILKCLEKDPDHRYQSARDLLADFRRLGAPAAAPPIQPRRRWVAALVLLAVPGLLALLLALNVGGLRQWLLGSSTPQIQSLAVLPLKNLMGDAEQDYFVEGMHEALITELSKISALKVISRTSAMRYKDTDKPLPQIARELNVNGVIEGLVLREGDQVRITVQLIDGPSDRYLWAQSFDRELRGILALQSEVARAIASEIKITLSPAEDARLASARPVNPEAYQLYLRGRYHWNKRTEEGFRKGLEYFNQAIEKDPSYALAYAGVAYTYNLQGHELFSIMDPRESYPKARIAALKALELDESLAEAHAVLGDIKLRYEWDWTGAEKEHKRAIELNPSYATAHQWYSHYLFPMGRREESLAESQRALELDPLSLIINLHLGWHYLYARHYDKAVEQLQKTLELDPDFILAHLFLGQAYEQKAMYKEAIAEFQKAINLSKGSPVHVAALGHAYAVAGQREKALKVLHELKQLASKRYVPSYEIAVVYAGLGDRDQALAWLQKAYEQRDSSWLVDVNVDPRFDHLHSAPRFQDLLRRMNFP